MDYEKIRTDFEKRYGKTCESIYFVGKKVDFFSKDELSVSACLTVGEALALTKRQDEKITVQVSGEDDMVSFSASELEINQKNSLASLLIKAREFGIKSDGADIFIYKNTGITNLFKPLMIGGLSGFCQNVPPKERLIPLFENYVENMKTLSGRKGCFLIFDGQKVKYKAFFGGRYKIVIASLEEEKELKTKPCMQSVTEGIDAIKKGDAEAFGRILNVDTVRFLETQEKCKAHKIYSAVTDLPDAVASGILDGGDVYSLVKNDKIDVFIHDTQSVFRKKFGGNLNFYVTDFADSGVFIKSDN